ncbi:MAG TPA: aconitate hydratase [Candidatus Limnocylindria bacterium]|nr:aconitate hydratase [Candidatus Limnocylindria bacterium]
MGRSLTRQIIETHLVDGRIAVGSEIAIRIDQALTQDATGTLAALQFEALGIERARCEVAVSYVDHNMLQTGSENADDHRFLRTFSASRGIRFSRPGNGICHQIHLERFGLPGKTLLGSDSHTPTGGGLGMLAIGAGGLDVALAMAGQPFRLAMPRVLGVTLLGRLAPWVTAKDIILEVLRRLGTRGGVGRVIEYRGEGVATLSVPERATIANMGAELGATSSVFPSDEQTRRFLEAQGRADGWKAMAADVDAAYDDELEIALGTLEPLIALPHAPDNVVTVRSAAGTPVQQVAVGSCTNSSYRDLMIAAKMLDGRRVHPDVSLVISPGSRQAFLMAELAGAIENFIEAGARILESACGPCIGMGQAPATGSVSLRSFNRNFAGRSGTPDALVHLASVETCIAAALTGVITDPRDLGMPFPDLPAIPARYVVDDSGILAPDGRSGRVVVRGPNIAALPELTPLPEDLEGRVLLALGDDITTDDILPAGAKILPLRSNLPALSRFTFSRLDPTFAERASAGPGIIVAGQNYGQGSSREHAALAPRILGVRAVIARSFARIHRSNLINFGILPLTFASAEDRDAVVAGDQLRLPGAAAALRAGDIRLTVDDERSRRFEVDCDLNVRERAIVLAGGALAHAKQELGLELVPA